MHRPVLALLVTLAASACTYGSAIDIAPFDARVGHAVLPAGDYCEMTLGAPPRVISSEGCMHIAWDGVRRIHTMTDLPKPEPDDADRPKDADKEELAVVDLGDGLYAARSTRPMKWDGTTCRLPGERRCGRWRWRGHRRGAPSPCRRPSADGLENLPPERATGEPARLILSSPLIRSATVEEIRDFLREASVVALREDKPDLDDPPSVGIRDTSGAADHAPSQAQLKAGRDLLKLIEQMRKQKS